MKVSYSWLKEHLDPGIPAKDLAKHLLQLGFEVSALERRGPAFSGVVTAQILSIEKHPNADRLSLCKVTDGSRELSIVCGAKNIAVGQKVPLALIGAKLPGGREITPAKIRGVESQGMICSGSELGLAGENGGILVLDPRTDLGKDLSKSEVSDDIMEVEITPNRPDCLSHLGLARELSAYFRMPLKERPAPKVAGSGACFPVAIEAAQACPRYFGRMLTGVTVGPSPGWLAAKLEAVGLRPINNVVDATNFILMDLGQPMHAFDLDKLSGRLVARFAKKGERLKALDEREYALDCELLVIADDKAPQAIAGVMGGWDSAVTAKTANVFLEAAYFAPPAIRKAAEKLRLRSDSSYRFERGTDLAMVERASDRAAELILATSPKAKASEPVNAGLAAPAPSVISTTPERINAILGAGFAASDVETALNGISPGSSAASFAVPSWRGDLETPWDLAEEVARLLGYDNIPQKAAPVAARPSRVTPGQALAAKLRARLCGFGLREAYNYDFVSEKTLERCGLDPEASPKLANPISEDWTLLRPSLVPGLLQNAALNLNRGAASVRLFELGKVYAKGPDHLDERTHAAGLLLGPVTEAFWKPSRAWRADVSDALGLMRDLVSGLPDLSWSLKPGRRLTHPSDALFHTHAWQSVAGPRGALGAVGALHPRVARAFDLEREGACLFWLDLDALVELAGQPRRFEPFSQFPSVTRDLSILVDAAAGYYEVEAAAQDSRAKDAKLELIDLFTGKNVPEGKKSLTLRLTFSRLDRTLRDEEVAAAMDDLLTVLKKKLRATLRS